MYDIDALPDAIYLGKQNDTDPTILEWTVSDTDTEIAGKGWAEIVMTDTDTSKRSKTFATLISSGLTVTA
jgi:hypothetical protein